MWTIHFYNRAYFLKNTDTREYYYDENYKGWWSSVKREEARQKCKELDRSNP